MIPDLTIPMAGDSIGTTRMPSYDVSVVIDRPVEEVFAFVENPENDPIWRNSVVEAEVEGESAADAGEVVGEGLGATGREVYKLLGREVETRWEIVAYEPNRKVAYRSTSGPFQYEGVWTYRLTDGGTEITFAIEWELVDGHDFDGMADRVWGRVHRQNVEGSLQALKKLLEA